MTIFNCTLRLPTQAVPTFSYNLENALHESWFNHLKKLNVANPSTFGTVKDDVVSEVWIVHKNNDYNSWPHKLVIQREVKHSLLIALGMDNENWRKNKEKIKVRIQRESALDQDDYLEREEAPFVYIEIEIGPKKN